MRFRLGIVLVVVVAFAAVIGGTEMPAFAGTQTVTNLADSGAGSLRAAIAAAASGDTINFQPGLTGTITLTSGEITIDKTLTITGPGAATLSVDGNLSSRIFNITNGASTVAISGLTFTRARGTSGGAIDDAAGSLTVSDTVFNNNAAGGPGGAGADSGLGYGGAILVNCCGSSGLTVANSAFIDNHAGGLGGAGGDSGLGYGGAIDLESGSLSVTGSTFSGNSAGGAGGDGADSGLGYG